VMGQVEISVKNNTGQWLWQHDRWKQAGINHVKRKYRYSFILVVFPDDPERCLALMPLLAEVQKIYPRGFLTLLHPAHTNSGKPEGWQLLTYQSEKELYLCDGRIQLVLDFFDSSSLRSHLKKQGAFVALSPKKLLKLAKESDPNFNGNEEEMVYKALCKK
jgi:hypothetical protein